MPSAIFYSEDVDPCNGVVGTAKCLIINIVCQLAGVCPVILSSGVLRCACSIHDAKPKHGFFMKMSFMRAPVR